MATHNGNLLTSGSYSYRVRAVLTGVRTPTAGETSIPITLRTYIVAGNRIIDNENTYTRTSVRLGNTSGSKAISTPPVAAPSSWRDHQSRPGVRVPHRRHRHRVPGRH